MSNSFEDKMGYLADLTEYAGMVDIEPLLKANKRVFKSCVAFRDGEEDNSTVSREQMENLWDTVCTSLGMDPDKEYLDWEFHTDGGVFVVEYYKRKGKIV